MLTVSSKKNQKPKNKTPQAVSRLDLTVGEDYQSKVQIIPQISSQNPVSSCIIFCHFLHPSKFVSIYK